MYKPFFMALYIVLGTVWRLDKTKLRPKHRSSIYFFCAVANINLKN